MSIYNSNALTKAQADALTFIAPGARGIRDHPGFMIMLTQGGEGGPTKRTKGDLLARLLKRGLIYKTHTTKHYTDWAITERGEEAMRKHHVQNQETAKIPRVFTKSLRAKAQQLVAEMRDLGFEDPVDCLLAIAQETDEAGEWKHPIEIRIDCLKAAAPYIRPKLGAMLTQTTDGTKTHAEWLDEVQKAVEEIEPGMLGGPIEGEVIEVQEDEETAA